MKQKKNQKKNRSMKLQPVKQILWGYSSSNDEDASRLDMIIQGAYSCNPLYFSSLTSKAAERNSLLLFDKDLCDGDGSGRVTWHLSVIIT